MHKDIKTSMPLTAARKTSRNVTRTCGDSCSSRNNVRKFHRNVLWFLQQNPKYGAYDLYGLVSIKALKHDLEGSGTWMPHPNKVSRYYRL